MKKLKNVLPMVFLLVIVGLIVSGCGEGQESTTKSSEDGSNEKENESSLTYPERSLKMIVPYSAGGGTDTVARAVSQFIDMDEEMVVTNLDGGSGKIGTMEVVESDPDGYTLLTHSVTATVSGYYSGLYENKIWEEMEPVAAVASQSGGIVVRADSKWETIDDLVDYAKDNPGELSIGLPGIGGGAHVISAVFADAADIEVNYVPYDGSSESRAALAGNHIDIMAGFVSEFYDFIQEGDFRMLATTGSERSPMLEDVPTFKEMDIEFVLNHRNGIFAPKGTPKEVIDVLNEKIKEVTEDEEYIELMNGLVTESAYLSAEDFTKELKDLDNMIEPVGDLIKAE
ncbi:tripartite tricarboxylate transporter substrate binding protein [Virgibacillus sp. W0181]|uniref:tripartite tricarboxylate transporter substrate binding protein n=1 Tax=Virgibacillus sp. W0181 TaxID=3391581 RepID=UPI003F48EAC1